MAGNKGVGWLQNREKGAAKYEKRWLQKEEEKKLEERQKVVEKVPKRAEKLR